MELLLFFNSIAAKSKEMAFGEKSACITMTLPGFTEFSFKICSHKL